MHSGPSMLRTRNIGAYRDLLVLFTKYGRKDFRLALQPEDLLVTDRGDGAMEPDVKAEEFLADFRLSRIRGVRILIASAAAIYLMVSTLMHDRKDEERAKLKGR
jgi:hypothetical protein